MALNLPHAEYVTFGRSPLKFVVFQLAFPAILSVSKAEYVAAFQEAIRAEYPMVEPAQTIAGQVVVAPWDPSAPPPSISTSPLWQFLDSDRAWQLTLAPDFLALQTSAYRDFPDIRRRLQTALTALQNTIAPNLQLRVGLRYVNEIRHAEGQNPSDWAQLLRPELVGLVGSGVFDGIDQALQEIRAPVDRAHFVVKHGFFGSETPLKGPLYLLDFDCFDAETKPFDVASLLQQLETYNGMVYDLFRWTLTPKLLASFEPVG
ncbi:MAG: TIGR04255 family protein [Chloroflexota bacterium]